MVETVAYKMVVRQTIVCCAAFGYVAIVVGSELDGKEELYQRDRFSFLEAKLEVSLR